MSFKVSNALLYTGAAVLCAEVLFLSSSMPQSIMSAMKNNMANPKDLPVLGLFGFACSTYLAAACFGAIAAACTLKYMDAEKKVEGQDEHKPITFKEGVTASVIGICAAKASIPAALALNFLCVVTSAVAASKVR